MKTRNAATTALAVFVLAACTANAAVIYSWRTGNPAGIMGVDISGNPTSNASAYSQNSGYSVNHSGTDYLALTSNDGTVGWAWRLTRATGDTLTYKDKALLNVAFYQENAEDTTRISYGFQDIINTEGNTWSYENNNLTVLDTVTTNGEWNSGTTLPKIAIPATATDFFVMIEADTLSSGSNVWGFVRDVNVSFVPEPASFFLLVGGIFLTGLKRRTSATR